MRALAEQASVPPSSSSERSGTPGPSPAVLLAEEVALHQRVCGGDESALLEYLDRIGHVVYCAALARTGDATAAEDLTEQLFVELWRRPQLFSPADGPVSLQLLSRMAAEGSTSRRSVPKSDNPESPATT